MKHTIIFLFLSQFAVAYAQDYLPIRQGRTYFWTENLATRIDSIRTDSAQNQTFWFTQTSRFCEEISKNVFRDSSATDDASLGLFWVNNGTLPPFAIPYTLQANQEFPFLQINDTTYTWKSEGLAKASFLGTSDSVLTLRIIVRDNLGQELTNHPLHQKAFIISKNHGALNWLGKLEKSPYAYPDLFSCVGISNPDLAESGLSQKDVYDIFPGDEVHHIEDQYYYGGYQASYWKWVCVDRDTVGNEQIRIIRQNTKRSVDMDADSRKDTFWTNTLNYRDTLIISLTDIPVFPFMVGNQAFPAGDNYAVYGPHYIPNVKGFHITSAEKTGNLWCETVIIDQAFGTNCFEGLGCYKYFFSGLAPFGSRDQVIFYSKENSSWGTPLPDSVFSNTVSVSDPLSQEPMRVFPNPGTSIITLSNVADQTMIEIFDLTGKQVWRGSNHPQGIDLSELSAGMYHIRLPEMNVSLKWRKE